MHASPFSASLDPSVGFDPARHMVCGDVFVARHMSEPALEVACVTRGVGLVERATEGWLRLVGSQAALRLGEVSTVDVGALAPGQGAAGEWTVGDVGGVTPMWVFAGNTGLWLSVPRVRAGALTEELARRFADVGGRAEDWTGRVERVGLAGPDSVKLLAALEFDDAAEMAVGAHRVIDVVGDAVRVCRTDFVPGAPARGFDLVIDSQTFNAVLAVLCSWAVRLGLRLLPCGVGVVTSG